VTWRAVIEPPGLTDLVVSSLTRALFRIDLDYLLRNPDTPKLYQSGVRYQREPQGQERWLSVPFVLQQRQGDCEDLASWLAAEIVADASRAGKFDLRQWLRRDAALQQQLPARPTFRSGSTSGGANVYHVLTAVGAAGRTEDPSRRLGM